MRVHRQSILNATWPLILAGCVANGAADAEALLQRIHKEGAAPVVRALVADQARWDSVMSQVARGEAAWIDVAVALRKASDAGASSELQSALFLALGKGPNQVLQRADDSLLSAVCAGRVDPPEPYDAAVAEIRRVRAAVESVKTPDLGAKKQMCVAKLVEGEAALRTMFGVPGQ